MKIGWHGWLWKLDEELTSNFHMNENQLWKPILFIIIIFWRTGQVLSKNFHLVLSSLGFKVPK
jgi:hypothetical protein